jgi:hypothetical protein
MEQKIKCEDPLSLVKGNKYTITKGRVRYHPFSSPQKIGISSIRSI